MNGLEEQLTDTLSAAADTVSPDSVRPLLRPPAVPRLAPRRRWNAWLAPAAAAAAVVLVAAVALVATSGTSHDGTAAGGGGPAAGPAAGPPRYYAEVEGKFAGWHGTDSVEVVIRSSATGAVAARVTNPVIHGAPRVLPTSVAAAPGGRTFYALYMNYGKSDGEMRIYRFRLTSSGPTAPVPIAGGVISGQEFLGNVGGFTVSPDGSRLALAVANTTANSINAALARKILVINLRTGARVSWQGGLDRAGLAFGIENLSWSPDSLSLVFLGEWCPPDDVSYGFDGGFSCSTLGQDNKHPVKEEGSDAVREIRLASGSGSLGSGRALTRASAALTPGMPVVAAPDGSDLVTIVPDGDEREVVTISMTTGAITGRLGPAAGPVFPDGGLYLATDPASRYVLTWEAGNSVKPVHGYVHAGHYHALAPAFPLTYPGGSIQMTW
jgi:hypothetical protein